MIGLASAIEPNVNEEKMYLGIDIAGVGKSSISGVAGISELRKSLRYSFPQGDWHGDTGLAKLAKLAMRSCQTALDQPFSYARETMRLLLGEHDARGDAPKAEYCSRVTDVAMRRLLQEADLSSNYVMVPNRCQNIWRALALAKQVGLSREDVCLCNSTLVETHPRVTWSFLLSALPTADLRHIIGGYKGSEDPASEPSIRMQMLAKFEEHTGILPIGDSTDDQNVVRREACSSSDAIEALICAYVAYLHHQGDTMLCGFPSPRENENVLMLEGAAVLPANSWSINP